MLNKAWPSTLAQGGRKRPTPKAFASRLFNIQHSVRRSSQSSTLDVGVCFCIPLSRDGFPRLRFCGKISRRRRQFFGAAAMDARAASIEAGRNLARTYAERGKLFRKIDNFQRQLRAHGLSGRYCLLYQKTPDSAHNLDALRCIGISKRELLDRLAGPNALLNLS